MPAARYWRVVGISTYGGGDLELSDIALYSGGTRVDGSATFTSTFAPISAGRWAAADVRQPGFALQWDFGVAQDVDGVALSASPALLDVYSFDLQYSLDNSGFVLSQFQFFWPRFAVGLTQGTSYEVIFPLRTPSVSSGSKGTSILISADTRLLDANSRGFVRNKAGNKGNVTGLNYGGSGLLTSTNFKKFGAASFDLTSKSIFACPTVPYVADFLYHLDLGVTEFTIEGWFYAVSASTAQTLFGARNVNNGQELIALSFNASGVPLVYEGTTVRLTGTTGIATGVWSHFALTRDSTGKVRVFIDGVQNGADYTSSAVSYATEFCIGRRHTVADYFDGYVDEVRVVKGHCLYTANFTPPTSPFSDVEPPVFVRSSVAAPPTRISEYTPPATVTSQIAPAPQFALNPWWGTGTITGTVKRLIPPSTTQSLARRVRLFDTLGMKFVDMVVSDPITGQYTFNNVIPGNDYTVVAEDHEDIYRAAIVNGVRPA